MSKLLRGFPLPMGILPVLLTVFLVPSPGSAQTAEVLLHSRVVHDGVCVPEADGGAAPTDLPCTSYDTSAPIGRGTLVYLVARNSVEHGVVGLSCGIDYGAGIPAEYVLFTQCSDGLSFPNSGPNGDFPAPGGGLRITWLTCQDTDVGGLGAHAIAGAFYVYAYSMESFKVTPNNGLLSGPELRVIGCDSSDQSPDPDTDVATVVFSLDGSIGGATPCGGGVDDGGGDDGGGDDGGGDGEPDDPVVLLGDLIAQVLDLNLDSGIDNSLDAKLSVAYDALTDMQGGNDAAAVNLLEAFISEVEAQRGNQIPETDADALIANAQAILLLLDQGSSGASRGSEIAELRGGALLASPNPFRADTRIRFVLPRESGVGVAVFDIQGRKVADLFHGSLPAGEQSLAWDGTSLSGSRVPAGIYLARVTTREGSYSMRLVRSE
jgi:FlgD Ig-like domain/FIMAH domain